MPYQFIEFVRYGKFPLFILNFWNTLSKREWEKENFDSHAFLSCVYTLAHVLLSKVIIFSLSLFTIHSCACVSLFDIRSARTIPFVVVCKRENDKWKQRWRNNKNKRKKQKYCEEPECVRCVWWIVQLRLVFEVVADMNSTGLDVQM